MNRHSTLGLLVAASLGIAGTARAVTTDADVLQIQSESVRYDAAQIRDEQSAKELFLRIRRAAEEVCRVSAFPRGYEIWFERDCEAGAVAQAVREAGLPALNDYYERAPRALFSTR